MLIKITLILIVISIALRIIAKIYIKSMDKENLFRFAIEKKITKCESIFLLIIATTWSITFVMAIMTTISLILRYL